VKFVWPSSDGFRVKHYESKLAALNAINSALQKENDKLREELALAQDPTTDAGEDDSSGEQGLRRPRVFARLAGAAAHDPVGSRGWRDGFGDGRSFGAVVNPRP
jgi:hypothetical protein